MILINRFDHHSFLLTLITLFTGFLVIAFTQFIRIWAIDAELGSFLATITLSLAMLAIAALYFLSSARIVEGGANEKKWARASSKYMLWQAAGYLIALIAAPNWRPYIFIIVFLYFNRYPFVNWINPKAPNTLPVELQNVPQEKPAHKAERIGLFSLLLFGLVIVLAATPLMQINGLTTVNDIMTPILSFGKIFLYVSIIWYIFYRTFELIGPKGHQFTTLTFVSLALLVANTQFMRIILTAPSPTIQILFAISTGLLLSVIATIFWNVKTMSSVPPTEPILAAFKQWAYLLYAAATAFFVSPVFMSTEIMTKIWGVVLITILIGLLAERRLTVRYYMGTREKPLVKFLDNQTVTGISFIVIGMITFFVLTALLGKPIASLWILVWVIPTIVGFFIILNHWLHTRIRPN